MSLTVLEYVRHSYEQFDRKLYANADWRIRDMMFMRRLDGVILLTLAYVALSIAGPRVMANYKALELKWTMFIYNLVSSLFSLWMCVEVAYSSWKTNYSYNCDPSVGPSASGDYEQRVADVSWWYFVAKGAEFMDTIFMIVKKKNSQISFLHVWHHSFMFPFSFFFVLFGPCNQGVSCRAGHMRGLYAPIINAFIHFVMYSYYALSLFPALHPYLFWKKYLTQMQLIQFILILISAIGVLTACDGDISVYRRNVFYAQLIFMGTLLILFGNFYVQSYVKGKSRKNLKENGMHDDRRTVRENGKESLPEFRINNGVCDKKLE